MMNRETAFFQRSVGIAQKFLQTAVVVDDRAFVSDPEPEPTGQLTPPLTPSTIAARDVEAPTPGEVSPQSESNIEYKAHELDAKPVIDGFARLGIVCAVLKRDPDDTLDNPRSRLFQLAAVADILVLDWQVHKDGVESAEETLELLQALVSRGSNQNPSQLRLIVVYTGEIKLSNVADAIRERLEIVGKVARDGDYALSQAAVRIVVLGKKTISGRATDAHAQEADFNELAERTVSEYAMMTAGLVSNVVLDALASLRCATHRILARFSTSLDAAFLVHRLLLDPPQDADEHLAPIIAGELQAVIEDAVEPFPEGTVAEWLSARELASQPHISNGFPSVEAEQAWIRKLCEYGYKGTLKDQFPAELEWLRGIGKGYGGVELDRLTTLISGAPLQNANEELAMLMAVKTRYSSKPPWLTLGTVVLQQTDVGSTYWLCLQPVCDSVRLSNARGFPMLKLAKSDARFGVVVRVDESFIRLRIDPRPFKVRTVEFKPDKTTKVVAATVDDHQRYWFESKEPAFRCRWIADLKFEQAQRAVQALANQNSRVGLTESEWQRRWDRVQDDA